MKLTTKDIFVFVKDTGNISLASAAVIPWFGMPGMGEKYVCRIGKEMITIEELEEMQVIEYVTLTELTNENSGILSDREQYYFLADPRIVQFRDNNFYMQEKIVPVGMAYSVGGLYIAKRGR